MKLTTWNLFLSWRVKLPLLQPINHKLKATVQVWRRVVWYNCTDVSDDPASSSSRVNYDETVVFCGTPVKGSTRQHSHRSSVILSYMTDACLWLPGDLAALCVVTSVSKHTATKRSTKFRILALAGYLWRKVLIIWTSWKSKLGLRHSVVAFQSRVAFSETRPIVMKCAWLVTEGSFNILYDEDWRVRGA